MNTGVSRKWPSGPPGSISQTHKSWSKFKFYRNQIYLITSRVSDVVEEIESDPSVCVCVRVCVCVCQRSHDWTVRPTDPIFGTGMNLDYISDEFDDQGQRSEFKVWKNLDFFSYIVIHWNTSYWKTRTWNMTSFDVTWRHKTSRYDKGLSSSTKGLCVQNDFGLQEVRQCWGVFSTQLCLMHCNAPWGAYKTLSFSLFSTIQWLLGAFHTKTCLFKPHVQIFRSTSSKGQWGKQI